MWMSFLVASLNVGFIDLNSFCMDLCISYMIWCSSWPNLNTRFFFSVRSFFVPFISRLKTYFWTCFFLIIS
jgi:hypothetical protein